MPDSEAAVYTAQYNAQESHNQAMAYKYQLEQVVKEKDELFKKYKHALDKLELLEDMIEELNKKLNAKSTTSLRYSG